VCGAVVQEGPPSVSPWYASGVGHWFTPLPLLLFLPYVFLKKWCCGDRSRASSAPVAHQRPVVASATELPRARGAAQGAGGIEVADAGPRLGDSVGSLLQDLVVRGADAYVPRSAAPGDMALAPRSLSAMGPGVSGLYLSDSPNSLPHPSTRDGWGTRQSLHVQKSLP
jgi:hypothetical protein